MKVEHFGSGVQHSRIPQLTPAQYPEAPAVPPLSYNFRLQGGDAAQVPLSIQHSEFKHLGPEHCLLFLFSSEGICFVASQMSAGHVGYGWQHSPGDVVSHCIFAHDLLPAGIYELAGQTIEEHFGLSVQQSADEHCAFGQELGIGFSEGRPQ